MRMLDTDDYAKVLPTDLGDEALPAEPKPTAGRWDKLFHLVPALGSLRRYSWHTLSADTIAGLTVAAVALPQAMAYALIAGIEPQYGLYTAIVMTAVGALLNSSGQLINGPTNAISIALLSALAAITAPEDKIAAAVFMALLVGLFQTGITLFRLGDLTRYISNAVIVGFTAGAAVLLVLDQFKNLLGLKTPAHVFPGDHFLKRFALTLFEGQVHGWTVLVSVGTIALLLTLRWLSERFRLRLPDFLLAVVAMALLVWGLDLEQQGVEVIARIPSRLPAFQLPTVRWGWVRDLAGSALAIALLGLLEAIAMAKGLATRTGQKLDMNQQCLSEGVANLTGSFFQCFPGSGSLTRSAINQQAGALTQWSGVIAAAAVAATVLLFAPLAHYIPRAALAGMLLVTAWRMVDRQQLRYHLRATRNDALTVVATALCAVVISVEFCIVIGVILSCLLYVRRAARIHLTELTLTPERVLRERVASDPPCGRILIFNVEGELFFGSAPDLERHLNAIADRGHEGIRVVVLRLKRARNPDAVCLALLEDFVQRMEARGIIVLLCGVRRDLAKILLNTGLAARLGTKHIFLETSAVWSSTLEAVRYAYDLLRGDLCPTCPRHHWQQGEEWYYMI